jgi:hypothetical protein
VYELNEFPRGHGTEGGQQFVKGVVDRQRANQGNKEQQSRKQRQQKIECELSGQAKAVVFSDPNDRSPYDLDPWNGWMEVRRN